jgi:hypothetical protein
VSYERSYNERVIFYRFAYTLYGYAYHSSLHFSTDASDTFHGIHGNAFFGRENERFIKKLGEKSYSATWEIHGKVYIARLRYLF